MNLSFRLSKYCLIAVVLGLAMVAKPQTAQAQNKPVVVFVHGFLGFCRDEALGYKYWGGLDDLQQQLNTQYGDVEVKTVCVGPVSSSYDRAIELFWKIKGGCIDYGAAHAAQAGHQRHFKNSTEARNTASARQCPRADAAEIKNRAVYPAWDASRPVHIIAHSQGGQTARMLAQLLADNGRNPEGDSGLFAPHNTSAAWIRSITTISTPNDGTTLADAIVDFAPFAQTLVADIALLAGASPDLSSMVYDFKLDQWDIAQRRANEPFHDYAERVLNNSRRLFSDRGVRDLSPFTLSPDGAMRENSWVRDQPGIYYFSWSTRSSYASWITGWHYPRWDANPLIGTFCSPLFMGNFTRSRAPSIDSSWWDSDCVVPTRSHRAPTLQIARSAAIGTAPTHRAVQIRDLRYGGTPRAGQWNWLGMMEGYDHLDIVGWTLFWSPNDKLSWYRRHIERLKALP
ncbi:esterase/lipase family protein [Pseudomarimonas arenosa]|uniref:triacylglycerol lipase n=1 Tax=Pseudomarimonas arenosa TaxID=2774145 RepID=A0AAW3ZQZ0_9GAMM|nr:lipase [Pseudomarimonas arenosa]MBD8526686.1 lipase [Pseudomarimonas arenosa]